MRILLQLFKYVILSIIIFFYFSNIFALLTGFFKIYFENIPLKRFLIFVMLLYLFHLILLFLIQKYYLDKGGLSSVVFASLINILCILIIGFLSYKIYNSNFLLYDINVEKYVLELENYGKEIKETSIKNIITNKGMFEFKKGYLVYIYLVTLLLLSNSIIIFLIYRKKVHNRFF